jgi:DnaJ-class molecular chaperone
VKLCGTCNGYGFYNNDICEDCGGEGIDKRTTFVIGKISRRKPTDFEENERSNKKNKFDKKNATRGGY